VKRAWPEQKRRFSDGGSDPRAFPRQPGVKIDLSGDKPAKITICIAKIQVY
jgi:hypothetical protein